MGETQVPEPDPENWQEQVKELARASRAGCSSATATPRRSRSGGSRSGPNSMPVLERNLAVLVAAGLPPRVIAYAADMFALYVGGFAFEESMRCRRWATSRPAGPARRVLPLAAAREFPSLVALADDLVAGDATSASSSRSTCWSAGSRRWPRRTRTSRRAPSRPAGARALGLLEPSSPIPRSTGSAFVNWMSPYSTISKLVAPRVG